MLDKDGALFLARFAVKLKLNFEAENDYKKAAELTLKDFVQEDATKHGRLIAIKHTLVT